MNSAAVFSGYMLTCESHQQSIIQLTLQEGKYWDNTAWRDVNGEFIFPNGELLDIFWHAAHQPSTVTMHVFRFALIFIGRVDDGNLQSGRRVSRGLSHILGICGHCDRSLSRAGDGAKSLLIAALGWATNRPQS